MEDFCRFSLNAKDLSARSKHLRHRLSAAVSTLDQGALLSARDTPGDVGTAVRVDGQLSRVDLADCVTAAAKRVSEALRVLSESVYSLDPAVAADFESIRYASYTLEKDIFLTASARQKFASVRLYVLLTCDDPSEITDLTHACSQNGADCIQLRIKHLHDAQALACARDFVARCKDNNVLSIINDRLDIAATAGADGVHLGQDDVPISAARALAPCPMIFGASTHSLSELTAAIELRADYIGVGPAFTSPTKPGLRVAGLEYLSSAVPLAAQAGIPAVAVGGITLENLDPVLKTGISAVAVGSAITDSPDPAVACRAFKAAIARFDSANPHL
jgi:thiamine-phosphate pyrophosphorylase